MGILIARVFSGLMKLNVHRYIHQIDHLFWTGQLQGDDLLEMHQQIQAFVGGRLRKETLQAKIDQYDRGWMP